MQRCSRILEGQEKSDYLSKLHNRDQSFYLCSNNSPSFLGSNYKYQELAFVMINLFVDLHIINVSILAFLPIV
jgi:hypothetical protein